MAKYRCEICSEGPCILRCEASMKPDACPFRVMNEYPAMLTHWEAEDDDFM